MKKTRSKKFRDTVPLKQVPEVLWQKKGKVQGLLLPQGERGSKSGYLKFSGGRRVRSRVSSPRGRGGAKAGT
jgi:hypothetical protein